LKKHASQGKTNTFQITQRGNPTGQTGQAQDAGYARFCLVLGMASELAFSAQKSNTPARAPKICWALSVLIQGIFFTKK
jgi:hypothetical protein